MTADAPSYTWPSVLTALLAGRSLEADATAWAMTEIMAGEASPSQVAAFAVALRAKGETPDEVSALSRVMLANATPVDVPVRAVDVVGTGGDLANTVNISTMAALVTAGAGIPVAKHGNRSASSACGAADVLEALDVVLALTPENVVRCVTEAGIGFFFAAHFHAGMRHAAVTRREIGIPTVFNFLGPLSNPARPVAQAVGCANARMAPIMARVLADRGVSALLFRGDDGLDELTTTTTSRVWVVHEDTVTEVSLDPADLDVPRASAEDLRGGDAAFNSAAVRRMLAGERGPVRDAVVLNAAAAIAAYDGLAAAAAGDLVGVLRDAMRRAEESIDSGSAAGGLDRWAALSRSLA